MTKKINNSFIAFLLLAATFNLHKTHAMEQSISEESTQNEINDAFIKAAQNNDCSTIKKLLSYGADINTTNSEGVTALMLAIGNRYTDAIQCLLSNPDIAINQQDNTGMTALMLAAVINNCRIIRILLAHGADINKANFKGQTALILAVLRGNTNAVKRLLSNPNLAIDQQDNKGYTALMVSLIFFSRTKNKLTIRRLLNAGADPEIAAPEIDNNAALTPLEVAEGTGDQEVIDLIQNAINDKQNTALIEAAKNNDCPTIQKCLNNGANINIATSNGFTALMIAIDREHTDAVQCLVGNPNIAIDQRNNEEDNDTALMLALLGKNKLIIKLLLDAGADPELADSKRRTPLKVAQQIGDAEILSLINKAILKKHGVVNIVTKTQK